jgi:hypothetical protein
MVSTEDYKLPVTDVQNERRNFPGYEKGSWYSLAELQAGDAGKSVTDTDSATDTTNDAGAKPMQKQGKPGRSWKASSKRTKEN